MCVTVQRGCDLCSWQQAHAMHQQEGTFFSHFSLCLKCFLFLIELILNNRNVTVVRSDVFEVHNRLLSCLTVFVFGCECVYRLKSGIPELFPFEYKRCISLQALH